MDLYQQIYLRKSCRKYKLEPLSAAQLADIEGFISTMRPLFPDAKISHRLVGAEGVKGLLAPKAPHYLIISGQSAPERDLNVGFLFQQLDLYLSALGLGACWLGGANAKKSQFTKDDILAICFGETIGSNTRTAAEFKRKSLAEISSGEDARLEAARLAPSGLNSQPWYFIAEDGLIHVYKKNFSKLKTAFYPHVEVDIGIALCHLFLASEALGKPFEFKTPVPAAPAAPQGFSYVGTVC